MRKLRHIIEFQYDSVEEMKDHKEEMEIFGWEQVKWVPENMVATYQYVEIHDKIGSNKIGIL